ncbi:MAG: helix-turn-helix domain-containing protein [Clostridiales bacterium]|nr:helix-turn-helix domain-containing protein [Clostridiales bacterium]
MNIKSPAVSGWKRGSSPKIEYVCKLARYFNVSADYLLGLSQLRNPDTPLADDEVLLLAAYRSADTKGKFQIIQACMNER